MRKRKEIELEMLTGIIEGWEEEVRNYKIVDVVK